MRRCMSWLTRRGARERVRQVQRLVHQAPWRRCSWEDLQMSLDIFDRLERSLSEVDLLPQRCRVAYDLYTR